MILSNSPSPLSRLCKSLTNFLQFHLLIPIDLLPSRVRLTTRKWVLLPTVFLSGTHFWNDPKQLP